MFEISPATPPPCSSTLSPGAGVAAASLGGPIPDPAKGRAQLLERPECLRFRAPQRTAGAGEGGEGMKMGTLPTECLPSPAASYPFPSSRGPLTSLLPQLWKGGLSSFPPAFCSLGPPPPHFPLSPTCCPAVPAPVLGTRPACSTHESPAFTL